jgi:hypothetical protein
MCENRSDDANSLQYGVGRFDGFHFGSGRVVADTSNAVVNVANDLFYPANLLGGREIDW